MQAISNQLLLPVGAGGLNVVNDIFGGKIQTPLQCGFSLYILLEPRESGKLPELAKPRRNTSLWRSGNPQLVGHVLGLYPGVQQSRLDLMSAMDMV